MTHAFHTIDRPGLGPEAAAAPAAHTGTGAGAASDGLECDEAEFVVYCFALCDWAAYDIAGGQVHIRGQA